MGLIARDLIGPGLVNSHYVWRLPPPMWTLAAYMLGLAPVAWLFSGEPHPTQTPILRATLTLSLTGGLFFLLLG